MSSRSSPSLPLTRRLILSGVTASAAQMALAQAPDTSLRPRPRPEAAPSAAVDPGLRPRRRPAPERPPEIAELLADARLGPNAQIAFVARDVETGALIEARMAERALPPASVNKAITAVYGLETLGAEHRFTTQLIGTGAIVDGRLEGDLALVGSGDPTLDSDDLFALASALKARGVREVAGRFVLWDRALPQIRAIDPGQPDHVSYNPAIGGLNLNFNRVHFEWRRGRGGYTTTMDARTERHRPQVAMARMSVADRALPVYTYRSGRGVDEWSVAKSALGNGGSRWLPVRHPALYCADVFATFARSHGIVLRAPERVSSKPQGALLAETRSDSLRRISQGMLRFSTNLTAEAIGLAATTQRAAPSTGLDHSAGEMSLWLRQGISRPGPALVDHSGLGDQSRITPDDMVEMLCRLGPKQDLASILRPIAMRDKSGNRVDAHPATILAKTGTLNFVSALAGYVDIRGRRLAFATFTADTMRRATIPREDREAPPGARSWARRSRVLQLRLIDRWTRLQRA